MRERPPSRKNPSAFPSRISRRMVGVDHGGVEPVAAEAPPDEERARATGKTIGPTGKNARLSPAAMTGSMSPFLRRTNESRT